MFRNIYLFLAFSSLFCASLFAQDEDATKPLQDTSFVIKEFRLNPITKKADSVLFDTTMQEYHTYNPAYKYSFSNSFLGNTGQAFQTNDLVLKNTFSPFIFEKPFAAYFHNPYSLSHYNTFKPFTQIDYVTFGTRDNSEQVIKALHTRNINEYANVGVLFDLIASKGIYLNQDTKANRFSFFGSYDKNAYSIFGNLSFNKIIQEENGGLIDIGQFEEHISNDPIAYRMFLDNADSKIKKNIFFVSQTMDILKKSSDTSSVKKKEESLFHLNHTFSYSKYDKIYRDLIGLDDTLDFYSNDYYQNNAANDSASTFIIENSFQISGDQYKFLPGFIAGFKHQYIKSGYIYPNQTQVSTYLNNVFNIMFDTIMVNDKTSTYNNMAVFFYLMDDTRDRVYINAGVEYFFAGYRQNDIIADFSIKYSSKSKKSNLIASGNFYLTEPDFFLKNYGSAHFLWNNQFSKMTNTGAKITFETHESLLTISAGLNLLSNYIYMNAMAMPAMADKSIFLSSLHIDNHMKWKGFNQINSVLIQKSNLERIIHIPLMAIQNTSYYENAFFKDALKFQLGFDLYYSTSYYADAYMPATGMFYLQDNRKVGNYPFLDAFLNWKIKRTRFFLKYTNSLAGLAGNNYFTTYGYPMYGRAIKFGLSWTFYD